jgi:hypothetical protein
MKKLTAMIILAVGCTTSTTPNTAPVITNPQPSPTPQKGIVLVPVNASKEESAKIKDAEKLINQIVGTKCFYDTLAGRQLVQTDGRTPAEVASHIKSLSGTIKVNMYYRCMSFGFKCLAPTSAVAYRDPPATDVYMNRAYFYVQMSALEWASTLAHEALGHSLGNYDHDYNPTDRRPYSVPYSIGFVIEKCGHFRIVSASSIPAISKSLSVLHNDFLLKTCSSSYLLL